MVKPKVAVLLAAYNGMTWIEQQLSSIQAQQYVELTIFISVDASIDGTQSWCAAYSQQHENVRLLPECGRLGGAGKNFFRLLRDIDFSAFEFVALADQDDQWHGEKLHRAVLQLQSGAFQGYSSNVTAFWADGRRLLLDKAQPQVAWDHLFEAAGPGCTYTFTSQLAIAFQAHLHAHWRAVQDVALHDWFLYAFARSNGFAWFIDPVPSMDYRQHDANVVGANTGWKSFKARWDLVRSGWWLQQVLLISSLCGHPWEVLRERTGGIRLTLFRLVRHARQCRRKPRDQWLFSLLCLLMIFTVTSDV